MAGGRWTEHVVSEAEAGRTVGEILRGEMAISGRMIQRLTRARGIMLNRRPAFLERRVKTGDLIAALLGAEEQAGLLPVEMPLSVLWEDDDALVLDKPAGLLVHPTSSEHTRTLAHGVAHHLALRGKGGVHPVHRIDRDTSGVVLFAKSAHAHAVLDAQLRERSLRRSYLALVEGVVAEESGTIDAPIDRQPGRPTLRMVRIGGEPARTHFRVAERLRQATLVELELETGRTHQIRVHMLHLGHPVLGDRWYGHRGLNLIKRQALHASRMVFRAVGGESEVEVSAPLPEDMARAAERLR
jgi:23S rRNA pseudouridine1911/1915/1917 synthase